MDKLTNHSNNDKALYSQKGIGIATFIGSPLASSILIKHNYDQFGEQKKGKITLLLGIVFTILIFVGLFSVQESIIDKIPQQIIPALYTAIIYLIVEKLQGNYLKTFEEEGLKYISNWKAAGIGTICLILILGGIMAHAFLDPIANAYDNGIQEFVQNEESAAKLYEKLNTANTLDLVTEINGNSIPKWKQNLVLLDSLDTNLNLSQEMRIQNSKLRKYSELRIEELGLLKQSILLNTMSYDYKLDSLNREMQNILDEIN